MEIKIESNVPIPSQIKNIKWPFADMEVGDSFFVEGKTKSSLHATAYNWKVSNKKVDEIKFVTKKVEKGARIWRVQ